MKEEDVEQPETPTEGLKKVKRSTSIILSSEAQQANSLAEKDATPTSHIVISEKPRYVFRFFVLYQLFKQRSVDV